MNLRTAALLLSVCVTSLVGCNPMGQSDLAPGVGCAAIRKVRLGMTEAEVLAILGPPLEKKENYTGGMTCGPTGCQPAYPPGRTQLIYSREVPGARWYPMLWVYLDHGHLSEVYAKRYIVWGADDIGVYDLSLGARTKAWERSEFEETFPP